MPTKALSNSANGNSPNDEVIYVPEMGAGTADILGYDSRRSKRNQAQENLSGYR